MAWLSPRTDGSRRGLAPWSVAFVLALGSLVGPSLAGAQTAPATAADQAEARRLFDAGRAHADAERWPDAVTAFEGSRALLERASTLFNLASALVRVGRALDALETLDALERIADPHRDRALLAGAPDLRARAESSIRHVVLTVEPSGASVEVDGEPIEGAGARRELTLDPGPHAASVAMQGYETQHVEIAIGNDAIEVALRARAARVHVEPSLTSASVSIDGTPRGIGVVDVELEPGSHVLEVTAHGHEPLTRQVDVMPGDSLTIAADLVALPVVVASGPDLPLIIGLGVGGAVLIAGIATALGVIYGTTTEAPSGGSTDTVIAVPLTSPLAVHF